MRTLLLLNVFEPEEVGARIGQARSEAGLTQPDLADTLGISLRQMQNLESGVSKPYKHLKTIAEATNRPFEWFLHGDRSEDGEQSLADQFAALREQVAEVRESADRIESLLQELQPKRRRVRSG